MKIFLLLVLLPGMACAQDYPPQLLDSLAASGDAALQPVQQAEIDREQCRDTGSPYIAVDFNGDGIRDYAALFRKKTDREIEWQGRKHTLYDLVIAAFTGRGGGRFETRILDRFEGTMPFFQVLELQDKGTIRGFDGDKSVTLEHEAIKRIYCEKSSTVFYWNNDEFTELWTSD